jgi:hypothetical protein
MALLASRIHGNLNKDKRYKTNILILTSEENVKSHNNSLSRQTLKGIDVMQQNPY